MPAPDQRTLFLQRAFFSAAERHGVNQESFAEVVGKSRSWVSHFKCAGPQGREMSLSDLVDLLNHAGPGQASADILNMLAARMGCRVIPEDAANQAAARDLALKEAAEAVAVVANPAACRELSIRECREGAEALLAYADSIAHAH